MPENPKKASQLKKYLSTALHLPDANGTDRLIIVIANCFYSNTGNTIFHFVQFQNNHIE